MSRTPWLLIRRHLLAHWVRSGLTLAALVVAIFLFCFLLSLVTTLNSYVDQAAANRLVSQSAVSLFVDLPRDYEPKIISVPGVEQVTKFQWFGGYYQSPKNFFAQFAVDPERFFSMYRRDLRLVEGPGGAAGEAAYEPVLAALRADRRACVIGSALAKEYGWKVGDDVPLFSTIFTLPDGGAWQFNVAGIYEPIKSNVDNRTMWFRYDYLAEALDGGNAYGPTGVGTYSINLLDGYDPAAVIAAIDGLFENGPQATLTTTEAVFQASFVSMMGNVPMFVGTIGGAVVFAVFFSVVNTMLMAGRQRVRDAGIMKALGFRDAVFTRLMLGESLFLCLLGGGLGLLLAKGSVPAMRAMLGTQLPNYDVEARTLLLGLGVALLVGVISGVAPGLLLSRLKPTAALRSEG